MRSYAKKLGDENFIHNIISIAMRYSNLGKKKWSEREDLEFNV